MESIRNNIKLKVFSNYSQMSQAAAIYTLKKITKNNRLLLCPAAGNTPVKMYNIFVRQALKTKLNTKELKVIKLDEWLGLSENDPASCEYQLKNQLINPLKITNYCGFNAENKDTQSEIEKYNIYLHQNGPIDICILGLGLNGHLGFNEPSDDSIQPFTHKAQLSASSLNHNMISEINAKPKYGLTLGMQNILASKTIILLVSGNHKKQAFKQLMNAQIDTKFPASFLWLHSNVICFCDEDVYK